MVRKLVQAGGTDPAHEPVLAVQRRLPIKMPNEVEGVSSFTTMWVALEYEVKMYFNMRVTFNNPALHSGGKVVGRTGETSLLLSSCIRRAIAESAVLHARILCDLFSSERKSKRYEDDWVFGPIR